MVNVVTLEGLDYSGKTTACMELARRNADKNQYFNEGVVYPTSLTARLLSVANQSTEIEREFLYTSMMVMDKNQASRNPDDRRTVIQDRYWPSIVSYGRFLNGAGSMHRNTDYSSLFIEPKATVLLSCCDDAIVERSSRRKRKSVIDKILLSSPSEIERLREEIESSVHSLPNLLRIDTTYKSVEDVCDEIDRHIYGLELKGI